MSVQFYGAVLALVAHMTVVAAANDCASDGKSTSKSLVHSAAGPIVNTFGLKFHPLFGATRLHSGIDYGGATGDPIRAAATGVVTFAGRDGGYGLRISLRHTSPGIETLYAHLATLAVTVGDCVVQGRVIGSLGSTGYVTQPHLHFELIDTTGPVNPAAFLPPG